MSLVVICELYGWVNISKQAYLKTDNLENPFLITISEELHLAFKKVIKLYAIHEQAQRRFTAETWESAGSFLKPKKKSRQY